MFFEYMKSEEQKNKNLKENNKMDTDDDDYSIEKEIVLAIKIGNLNLARKIMEENEENEENVVRPVRTWYNNNEIVYELLHHHSRNNCKECQDFLDYLNTYSGIHSNVFNDDLINRLYSDGCIGIVLCKHCIEHVLKCRRLYNN